MKGERKWFVVKTTYCGYLVGSSPEIWAATPSCEIVTEHDLEMDEAKALIKLLNGDDPLQNFMST